MFKKIDYYLNLFIASILIFYNFIKSLINNNMKKDIKNISNIKISIITVCFNSEKTIRKTLQSIKNQKYERVEHLIIDGKSTDKTISIVKKFPHVSRIISKNDKGIYDAMNKGIKHATGDVIGFLNSDDYYANNEIVSKVASVFVSNSTVDACYADLIYTDKFDISKNIRYWKSNKFKPGMFSKGWCPPHPTFFARRSVYERFGGFNIDYYLASDNDIMMRFLEVHRINVKYIPEVWVKMRLGGATNKNFRNILFQNLEILKALSHNGLSSNPVIFFSTKFL